MNNNEISIAALVLAAGQSKRMGRDKMTLPWGTVTVIAKVVATLYEARVDKIVVIAGNNSEELMEALHGYKVQVIINKEYENGEMISSVKAGLNNLDEKSNAALIVLGDQPQIEATVVKSVTEQYENYKSKIIVPSFEMRRGHPVLIDQTYWDEIRNLSPSSTLKIFLDMHRETITYVDVESPSILEDLDTPEDYHKKHQ